MKIWSNEKWIRKIYDRRGNKNCSLPVDSFLLFTSKIYTQVYMYMIGHVNIFMFPYEFY